MREFKGELKGFPQEIVNEILRLQVQFENKKDVSVFEKNIMSRADDGGVDWDKTKEGEPFWRKVLYFRDFSLFSYMFGVDGIRKREFIVIEGSPYFAIGKRIMLCEDDGTECPFFWDGTLKAACYLYRLEELPEQAFPRVMLVSDDGEDYDQRVVIAEKCGKFIAWLSAENFEKAEEQTGTTTWKYAKDLPQRKEMTVDEIEEELGYKITIIN